MERIEPKKMQGPRKKMYQTPELKPLGSIIEITRGPEGGDFDTFIGGIGGFDPVS